jgi:hypothetical protein
MRMKETKTNPKTVIFALRDIFLPPSSHSPLILPLKGEDERR